MSEHPNDCQYCVAGEPMNHNYEPPTDPGATKIVCPHCQEADLSFDWEGVVTARITDGKVEYITVGGVLGSIPDRVMCNECGGEIDLNARRPLADAASAAVDNQLPAPILDQLTNGSDIWEAKA